MISTNNLSFAYNKEDSMSFPDLTCTSGDVQLILGPSGSGKTTLLNLLAGLLVPSSGNVQIGETDINSLKGTKKDRFRGCNIGLVFQTAHFIRSLSVADNLRWTQKLAGLSIDDDRINNLLERLNILQYRNKKTDQLSVGEQQRVAIARALINQPKVILADEPTSALDDAHCREVIKLIQSEAKDAEAALLIVTHDTRLKDIVDKKIVLNKILAS
jgi:putative ABC transport system ATP-binding protein